MVSFSCEACNDTVIKKKLDQHKQRCYDAYFTCIDCSITFSGTDYRGHTQCISEAEKYEKALYRGKPTKNAKQEPKQEAKKEAKKEAPVKETADKPKKAEKVEKVEKVKASKKEKSKKEAKSAVDLSKYAGDSLGKVLKSLAKDTKTDKKDLLKKLQLKLENGKVVLTL